jgi:surfactin synthase thioesterase subunit
MEWFDRLPAASDCKARLICFHHAGAGATTFYPWRKFLDPMVELVAIQLPGREARLNEPLISNMETVIKQLFPHFTSLIDKPYILFGHSLGALIAYEIAIKLQNSTYPKPMHLVVSGCRAPDEPLDQKVHLCSDAELIAKLVEFNGTPNEIMDDLSTLEFVLPIMRADFAISETYRHINREILNCDVTALGGIDDETVSVDKLGNWKKHTMGQFRLYRYPGDHFFIRKSQSKIIQLINNIVDN